MSADEQITVLQYVEGICAATGSTPTETQDRIDGILHAVSHVPKAPRIYEVMRASDGSPSLVWSTRTHAEWSALITKLALAQMFGIPL